MSPTPKVPLVGQEYFPYLHDPAACEDGSYSPNPFSEKTCGSLEQTNKQTGPYPHSPYYDLTRLPAQRAQLHFARRFLDALAFSDGRFETKVQGEEDIQHLLNIDHRADIAKLISKARPWWNGVDEGFVWRVFSRDRLLGLYADGEFQARQMRAAATALNPLEQETLAAVFALWEGLSISIGEKAPFLRELYSGKAPGTYSEMDHVIEMARAQSDEGLGISGLQGLWEYFNTAPSLLIHPSRPQVIHRYVERNGLPPVQVTIYTPSESSIAERSGKTGIVMGIHGYGLARQDFGRLPENLARQGLAVVLVTWPGANGSGRVPINHFKKNTPFQSEGGNVDTALQLIEPLLGVLDEIEDVRQEMQTLSNQAGITQPLPLSFLTHSAGAFVKDHLYALMELYKDWSTSGLSTQEFVTQLEGKASKPHVTKPKHQFYRQKEKEILQRLLAPDSLLASFVNTYDHSYRPHDWDFEASPMHGLACVLNNLFRDITLVRKPKAKDEVVRYPRMRPQYALESKVMYADKNDPDKGGPDFLVANNTRHVYYGALGYGFVQGVWNYVHDDKGIGLYNVTEWAGEFKKSHGIGITTVISATDLVVSPKVTVDRNIWYNQLGIPTQFYFLTRNRTLQSFVRRAERLKTAIDSSEVPGGAFHTRHKLAGHVAIADDAPYIEHLVESSF